MKILGKLGLSFEYNEMNTNDPDTDTDWVLYDTRNMTTQSTNIKYIPSRKKAILAVTTLNIQQAYNATHK